MKNQKRRNDLAFHNNWILRFSRLNHSDYSRLFYCSVGCVVLREVCIYRREGCREDDWREEMISLETAQRLKDAGLEWEPKEGDCWCNGMWMAINYYLELVTGHLLVKKQAIWLPRLDQLLAEIEKAGFDIDLMHFATNSENTSQVDDPPWSCDINRSYRKVNAHGIWEEQRLNEGFEANSPEEAAAQALLWILEQEAKHED
jgi:hypothetical protein